MKKRKPKIEPPGLFLVVNLAGRLSDFIQKSHNPTKLHSTLTEARDEAERLAARAPGTEFAVFKCDSITRIKIPGPTWRTVASGDIPTNPTNDAESACPF